MAAGDQGESTADIETEDTAPIRDRPEDVVALEKLVGLVDIRRHGSIALGGIGRKAVVDLAFFNSVDSTSLSVHRDTSRWRGRRIPDGQDAGRGPSRSS